MAANIIFRAKFRFFTVALSSGFGLKAVKKIT
jgi:hypothetical protein